METRRKILEILTENARTSDTDIAAMVGVSEDEVKRLIAEMEEQKIIRGYKAIVDSNNDLIQDRCTCLIEVSVQPERDRGFDAVAERIYKFPEVQSVYLLSGTYDLLVVIEGRTMYEIAQFVIEKLSTQPNVRGTASHFMLKKYKELGTILAEQHGTKRMPVSP